MDDKICDLDFVLREAVDNQHDSDYGDWIHSLGDQIEQENQKAAIHLFLPINDKIYTLVK